MGKYKVLLATILFSVAGAAFSWSLASVLDRIGSGHGSARGPASAADDHAIKSDLSRLLEAYTPNEVREEIRSKLSPKELNEIEALQRSIYSQTYDRPGLLTSREVLKHVFHRPLPAKAWRELSPSLASERLPEAEQDRINKSAISTLVTNASIDEKQDAVLDWVLKYLPPGLMFIAGLFLSNGIGYLCKEKLGWKT